MPSVVKPADTKGCPPQVVALVEHLRPTGTGEGKLRQLIAWGIDCEKKGLGAEEFLKRARTLTTGTVTKIDAYLANLKAAQQGPEVVGKNVQKKIDEIQAAKSQETPVEAVAGPAVEESKPEPSPAAEWNAKDAIEHIGRMTSVEKLEKIALIDERVTVTKAAESRLEELKNKPE
mgnify:CR=1 FL=1